MPGWHLWMARWSNLATQAREPHGGRVLDTIKTLKKHGRNLVGSGVSNPSPSTATRLSVSTV